MSNDKAAAVLERAREDGVKLVELQFVDIFGAVKSTTIPVERLEDTLIYGQAFDGSSIEGFARIQESDLILRPDPDTYAVLPWRPRSAGARGGVLPVFARVLRARCRARISCMALLGCTLLSAVP